MQRNAIQEEPWLRAQQTLKEALPQHVYTNWFKNMRVMSRDSTHLVLGSPNMLAYSGFQSRYSTMLSAAVENAYGRPYEIKLVDTNERRVEVWNPDEMLLGNENNLNPKYTFDTFVVGSSNRFAHAASKAVAEVPSDAYNPLFLYGGVGLGKTHLMHAIGHYILQDRPETKLLYITSERFTNDLISAIGKKTNQEFRDKLRNMDVLMIDDIQFIAGKTSTQEEFFHTFNHLHSSGKQIVISSDRPPKDIPTLEERLRSRFEWGLIADIQKPDYETRIAILQQKAQDEGIDVPIEVLSLIAEKVQSNIRELEGSLIRINAKAMLEDEPITLEMAERSISSIMRVKDSRRITPDLIMGVVAEYYHVEKADLLSQRRNREIALPRQIAMYLTRETTDLSTTRIGDAFGGRDHTTVMHACLKIDGQVKESAQFGDTIEQLKTAIKDA